MAKFQKVGSGFVKYGDTLMNLKSYKEITNAGIAFQDWQPSGIKFTPIQPLKEDFENNVDGSFYITYSADEAKELEQDFILIQEILAD